MDTDKQTFKNVTYMTCDPLIRPNQRYPPTQLKWNCILHHDIANIDGNKEDRREHLTDIEDVFMEPSSVLVNLHGTTFIIGDNVGYPPKYLQCAYYPDFHKIDCEGQK